MVPVSQLKPEAFAEGRGAKPAGPDRSCDVAFRCGHAVPEVIAQLEEDGVAWPVVPQFVHDGTVRNRSNLEDAALERLRTQIDGERRQATGITAIAVPGIFVARAWYSPMHICAEALDVAAA